MDKSKRIRRTISTDIRAELYNKYNGSCAFCGISGLPLEIAYIIPFPAGGTEDIENLILLCPNCHHRMDSYNPREVEFIDYLATLLELSPNFQGINTNVGVGEEFQADISAKRHSGIVWEDIVIECKTYSAFSSDRLAATIDRVKTYRRYIGSKRFILAFLGRISDKHRDLILNNNVELWDIDYLANTFAQQIEQIEHPYFQPFLLSIRTRRVDSIEARLLTELKGCIPGKVQWAVYQKLVANILEHLFCPPLKSPIVELRDVEGVNRRDLIMPNYALDGFWKFMRETYKADYIVVDAKNYKANVKKKEALQVANYLKAHGAGLFGLIICRKEADKGCLHTLREQWMAYGKMILLLNDEDLESMLLAKSSGGNPEDIISQKIEQFRLSV